MEPKKYPHADLNRNRGLYFVIGLTIVLFTTWRLLEHKTYDSHEEYAEVINVMDDLEEKVPITEAMKTPPPPAPPAAPDIIEIVDDVEEVEETIIESTESSQEAVVQEAVIEADDIDLIEEEEEVSVPFAVIENVPVFPGCENLNSETERKACFNKKIQEHIKKNFQYPETALELGISGKVFVKFDIQANGRVGNIQYRGPDKMLEKEAERIIASLPTMKPGIQRGRPAKVAYSIPINFMLQ